MRVGSEEYRVVCKHFPGAGHELHYWRKGDLALALQSVLDLNHRAEMERARPRELSSDFYVGEAPYRVQCREVGQWHDHQPELALELEE